LDGVDTLVTENESNIRQLLDMISNEPCMRERKLGGAIEKSRVCLVLKHFFLTGKVLSQNKLQPCNDNEYVGVLLQFAQDLNQYVIGRACVGDVRSIQICREFVTELNGKMLEFDFRNGPLRRKYDGLKYCLRTIEDIIFELSLQQQSSHNGGATHDADADAGVELEQPDAKRMRVNDDNALLVHQTTAQIENGNVTTTAHGTTASVTTFLDIEEMDQIRCRMERYDQLREQVIKESRDIQKQSKQAIFAIMRGQMKDARMKLDLAVQVARKVLAIVLEHPTLRQGSFSNSMEEWAEGELTLAWVTDKKILAREELGLPGITCGEYVGALSDFTGELGRLAVRYASDRNLTAVQEIHQVDLVLYNALTRLNAVGNKCGNKFDAVRTNLRKVVDILYEMSMSERRGRATRTQPSAPTTAGEMSRDTTTAAPNVEDS